MKFVQTGCGVAATLTTNYSTTKIYAGDSTCKDANSQIKLLTCDTKNKADATDSKNTKCNDVVTDFSDPYTTPTPTPDPAPAFDYDSYDAKIDKM